MRMNTTPTTASGAARLVRCWTAATSTPVTTEKTAGSSPRAPSMTHQASAIGRSARRSAAAS